MLGMNKMALRAFLLSFPLVFLWVDVAASATEKPVISKTKATKAKAKTKTKTEQKATDKPAEKPLPDTVFHCREDNVDVYTNTRLNKTCKATSLGPVTTTVVVKPATPENAAAQGAPSAAFPKVSESTQKSRDLDRRRILEEEAASEQKSLDVAKKELAAQEAKGGQEEKNYQKLMERLRPFKDKVSQHERNLQALRKELSGLPK